MMTFAMLIHVAQASPQLALVSASADVAGLNVTTITSVPIQVDYVEVCFTGTDEVLFDEHVAGESPEAGECEVGRFGFVVTTEQFVGKFFEAKAHCRRLGMRLATGEELQQLVFLAEHGGPALTVDEASFASAHFSIGFTDEMYVATADSDAASASTTRGYHCAR